jgi:hypothetical protein
VREGRGDDWKGRGDRKGKETGTEGAERKKKG